MLDIKKWKRMDIVYAILSSGISVVLVNVILIQQNGPTSKTIMFIILAVLLYFLFKYIQDYNKPSYYQSPVSGVVEDLKSHTKDSKKGGDDSKKGGGDSKKGGGDSKKGGDDSKKGGDDSKKGGGDSKKGGDDSKKGGGDSKKGGGTSSKDSTTEEEDIIESFDSLIEPYADATGSDKIYTGFDTDHSLQEEGDNDNYPLPSDAGGIDGEGDMGSNDDVSGRDDIDGEGDGDEGNTSTDFNRSLPDTIVPIPNYPNTAADTIPLGVKALKKTNKPTMSRDLPKHTQNTQMYKPYDTPININISYNTKSSTNTDDVISIKDRFSKPDESNHIFHNNIPEVNNMKINTNHIHHRTNGQDKLQSINDTLRNQDPNNNYYKPPDSRCHGSTHNPRTAVRDDKVYSGQNYEYIHPTLLENNINSRRHKTNACPMNINQNWSSWDPQYLSGDDTTDEMVAN